MENGGSEEGDSSGQSSAPSDANVSFSSDLIFRLIISQVVVYCCDVEFVGAERKWHPYHSSSGSPLDLPTSIGQRVEITDGPTRGFRGYAQGWDTNGIIVNLYFMSSGRTPSMGQRESEYWAVFGTICVPPGWIGRCFNKGDLVFKKGLRNARFLVHTYGDEQSSKQIHPDYIPLKRAVYNTGTSKWEMAPGTEACSMVHRRELVMADTTHDPILLWRRGINPFQENWRVCVIVGPFKGYFGRVRNVLRTEVEVDLEAAQKVMKFKPEHLARHINILQVNHPPVPLTILKKTPGKDSSASSSTRPPPSPSSRAMTPLPVISPPQIYSGPAWDPSSRTPEPSSSDSSPGSPWLLSPQLRHILDTEPLKFKLYGTNPDFAQGKYERAMVRTAPLSRRDGRSAGEGEVMGFLTFFPSSLTAIPVKYMYPVLPGPFDTAVVIDGEFAGTVVEVDDVASSDGHMLTHLRGPSYRWLSFLPTELVTISRR